MFVFNERRCYQRILPPEALRAFLLRRLRLPILLFTGRWGSLLPRRPQGGLVVVVGAPVRPRAAPLEAPSAAQVDALHAEYVAAVRALHKKWRAYAGCEGEELCIT